MRKWERRGLRAGLLPTLALAAAILGCGDSPSEPDGTPTFILEVSGEEFRVAVGNPDEVQAFEARLDSGARGVINGPLVAGDGGFNAPWSWHLDPAAVAVADLAIELCDGRPSMVESDLDYWLRTVGQFCPWGAKVVRRE